MEQKPAVWNLNDKTVTLQLSDDDWKKAEKMKFDGIWSFGFKPRQRCIGAGSSHLHNRDTLFGAAKVSKNSHLKMGSMDGKDAQEIRYNDKN